MKQALFICLLWSLAIYFFSALLTHNLYFDYSFEKSSLPLSFPKFLWHLASYDGVHYLKIASLGYYKVFETAFFPLYPLFINLFGSFTGNQFLTSLILSLLFTYLSVIGIYRLGGIKAVVLLLSFPLSFFLLCSYTESLFLSLSVWSYLFYKRGRINVSVILGILATATRFYGLFLFVLLLYESIKKNSLKSFSKQILLIPLGLVAYSLFLYFKFADPLAFFHSLGSWGKSTLTLPPQTIYRYLKILTQVSPKLSVYYVALLELVSSIYGLLLAIYYFQKMNLGYVVYILLGVLIPMMTGTLQSLPRYLISIFPIFLIPAKTKPMYFIVPLSFSLQAILFYAFLNGLFIS